MILACSGGSNVGQIANHAAVELTREGKGKMYCLAGIGGDVAGFAKTAGDWPRVVVIDGCELGCAKAIMDKAGLAASRYLVLTGMGIAKIKDQALAVPEADVARVKNAALGDETTLQPLKRDALPGCGCSGRPCA